MDEVLDRNPEKRNYNAYYLLVKYLVEHYDKTFVLNLFTSSRQAKEFLINELYDEASKHYNYKRKNY